MAALKAMAGKKICAERFLSRAETSLAAARFASPYELRSLGACLYRPGDMYAEYRETDFESISFGWHRRFGPCRLRNHGQF
jgi:hypothetical protein